MVINEIATNEIRFIHIHSINQHKGAGMSVVYPKTNVLLFNFHSTFKCNEWKSNFHLIYISINIYVYMYMYKCF